MDIFGEIWGFFDNFRSNMDIYVQSCKTIIFVRYPELQLKNVHLVNFSKMLGIKVDIGLFSTHL